MKVTRMNETHAAAMATTSFKAACEIYIFEFMMRIMIFLKAHEAKHDLIFGREEIENHIRYSVFKTHTVSTKERLKYYGEEYAKITAEFKDQLSLMRDDVTKVRLYHKRFYKIIMDNTTNPYVYPAFSKVESMTNEIIDHIVNPSRYFTSTMLMEQLHSLKYDGNMTSYKELSEEKAREFLGLYISDVKCGLDNAVYATCSHADDVDVQNRLLRRITRVYDSEKLQHSVFPLILKAYRQKLCGKRVVTNCDKGQAIFNGISQKEASKTPPEYYKHMMEHLEEGLQNTKLKNIPEKVVLVNAEEKAREIRRKHLESY
jgi:hypothetical protein